MVINEKNLRNNTDYIWETYGIMYGPEWYGRFGNVGEFAWWVPDAAANTTEDYEYIADYEPIKTSLKVSSGDQLVIHLMRKATDGYYFEIFKLNNSQDSVYVKYKTICGLYDDDRYEIVMKLAAGLKDIPNVSIEFFLHYNDEQILNYVNALEDYDAI